MNFQRIKSYQWNCFEGVLKCKFIQEWTVVIYFDLRQIRHWIIIPVYLYTSWPLSQIEHSTPYLERIYKCQVI